MGVLAISSCHLNKGSLLYSLCLNISRVLLSQSSDLSGTYANPKEFHPGGGVCHKNYEPHSKLQGDSGFKETTTSHVGLHRVPQFQAHDIYTTHMLSVTFINMQQHHP